MSLNIVPNVYNSLQNSFLSLTWPWPGRLLPNGSAEILDWGPMWSGSQSICHLQCTPYNPNGPQYPLTPPTPLLLLYPYWPEYLHSLLAPQCTPDTLCTPWQPPIHPDGPWHPYTPKRPLILPIPMLAPEYLHSLPAPNAPLTPLQPLRAHWFHLYPCWYLSAYIPCQPLMHSWHPLTPPMASNFPDVLTSLHPLGVPWFHLYPCWPLISYTPCQPPMDLDIPTLPDGSPMPLDTPKPLKPSMPLMLPIPLLPPWGHILPATPLHPLPAPWHPLTPPTSLLMEPSSGQQWYYCRSEWCPTENFYIWKTFYPWG